MLRDPLFLYAVEAGLTLTAALFLAELGLASDLGYLTVVLMALGLISIHAERAFPPEGEQFTRSRFGMPLFWSGHVQLGLSALTLLGTQIVLWLAAPIVASSRSRWHGNWLTASSLVAGALWLGMTYAYLYSDIVVRRSGIYSYLAAFCFLMAVITVVGFNLQLEWLIAILALTALAVNLVRVYVATPNAKMSRAIPPMALALSCLPILLGIALHASKTSKLIPAILDQQHVPGEGHFLALRGGDGAGCRQQSRLGLVGQAYRTGPVGGVFLRQRGRGDPGGRRSAPDSRT